MPQFRKKPVVIEAIQLVSAKAGQPRQLGPTQIPDWYVIAQGRGVIVNATDAVGNEIDGLFINTLEGTHHASPGDWIIQGVQGELYPCKPDIFAATYEPVDAFNITRPDRQPVPGEYEHMLRDTPALRTEGFGNIPAGDESPIEQGASSGKRPVNGFRDGVPGHFDEASGLKFIPYTELETPEE